MAVLVLALIYFKYKSTRAVAEALVDRGEEPFGIRKSKWKYYPFIWELIMFASRLTCFSIKSACCWNNSEENAKQTQTDDEEESNGKIRLTSYRSNNQTFRSNSCAAPVFLVVTSELLPSEEWKDSLEDIVKNFKKMLAECEKITSENFQLHFQKYANHQNSHISHCRHQGCVSDGHSQYIHCISLKKPVLYYVWLDWTSFQKFIQERESK